MKRLLILIICLAAQAVRAQRFEIVSPDHASTFAYGGVAMHQLEREARTNQLVARVTFSNRWYSDNDYQRRDEDFDFHFPSLRLDPAEQRYFASGTRSRWVPVAQLRT